MVPALAISLIVSWSDMAWAGTQREAARRIGAMGPYPYRKLWYQGHWGFQYYMDRHGGQAFDFGQDSLSQGDLMVIPANNTNLVYHEFFAFLRTIRIDSGGLVSTMAPLAGAGFYTDLWGPLPYRFGRPDAEQYHLFVIRGGS
jgi:hypothetical protein